MGKPTNAMICKGLLKNDELESLISLLPYATEPELKEIENYLALLTPGSFAQVVSQGRWTPARHLAYLDRAIVEAIAITVRLAGNMRQRQMTGGSYSFGLSDGRFPVEADTGKYTLNNLPETIVVSAVDTVSPIL